MVEVVSTNGQSNGNQSNNNATGTESPRKTEKQALNIDEMLKVVGEYGRFQKVINAMFCIITFPSAYQLMISYFAFIEPPWRCKSDSQVCRLNGTYNLHHKHYKYRCGHPRSEWEYTQPPGYSIITQYNLDCERERLVELTTGTLFIGWLFGAIFLGWCTDKYGRNRPLFISVAAVIIFGFISAFMPNITTFVICRFIIGFFLPGTFPQIMFTYISEVVGGKYRTFAGLSIFLFVGTALNFLVLKAYFIRNWRLLYIVCTAPYIFVLGFYKYVPESMRFLRIKGRLDETMEVFQLIAKRNGTEIPAGVTIDPPSQEVVRHNASPLDLFRTPSIAFKSLVQGVGYWIGAMTFFALYLGAADISGHIYLDYFIVTVVELPVCLMIMDFAERFGRKRTVMTSMLVGSLMCIALGFTPNHGKMKIARIVFAMTGKVSISANCNSFQLWSVELYPTSIRGEGMGFVQVMSRLGAASATFVNREFAELHEGANYIFIGLASFCTYFLLCFLPDVKGVADVDDPIPDTIRGTELEKGAFSNPICGEGD